jgi:hypothetical protein
MWQSRCCWLVLLTQAFEHHARLLQQFGRRVCAHMLHHRHQHSSGGFDVRLGAVVAELMADVRRQGVELVVWHLIVGQVHWGILRSTFTASTTDDSCLTDKRHNLV